MPNLPLLFFCLLLLSNNLYAASPPLSATHRYKLAICAISKNDAPYLVEWIQFHKCVGVDHFYLFNHGSEDDMDTVLQPFIDAGEVELFHWPVIPGQLALLSQVDAYNWALRYATGEAKWLAFLDTDEFLFPVEKANLVDFLADYEAYAGVTVNWQMYGTSGVEKLQPGQLMIEELAWKATADYAEHAMIKSIVRPEWTVSNVLAHECTYIQGKHAVDSDYKPVLGSVNHACPLSKVRINHYYLRDRHFAYGIKLARIVDRGQWSCEEVKLHLDTLEGLLNVVHDPILHRYIPQMRAQQ